MGNSGSASNIHRERFVGETRNSHFQTRFQHINQNSHRQLQWGRSGSGSSPISPQRSLTAEWRRSYPSAVINKEPTAQLETAFKVLPDVDKRLHLRATTNGAILNSGGTISGRKPNEIPNALSKRSKTFIIEPVNDRSSASDERSQSRPEFTRSQTLLYVKAKRRDADPNDNESNLARMQRHTYSEPELVNNLNQQRISAKNMIEPHPQHKPAYRNKYSKKRRAPEAPHSAAPALATPLLKQSIDVIRNTQPLTDNLVRATHFAKNSDRSSKLGSKQIPRPVQSQNENFKRNSEIRKSVNGNNFQSNPIEPAKVVYRREKSSDAIMLKSRKQPEQPSAQVVQKSSKQIPIHQPAVKSFTPKDHIDNAKENKTQRTFYFGMEREDPTDALQSPETGDARHSISVQPMQMIPNYDIEYKDLNRAEETLNDNGLHVLIRPTLPRRQIETPSFSPTMAWRSLLEEQERMDKSNAISNRNSSMNVTSEKPIQPNRITQIKQITKPTHLLTTWTPEQDLDDENDDRVKGHCTPDDSSSDEYRSKCDVDGFLFYGSKTKNVGRDTTSPIHTFSLSLPRETHIQNARGIGVLNSSEVCNYKSLQKSKPEQYFNSNINASSSQRLLESTGCATKYESSNNWMLHKNISSTDLHTKSLEHGSKRQRLVSVEPQSIKFLTGGKHVMYLPGNNNNNGQSNHFKAASPESQTTAEPVRTSRHFKSRQRHLPQSLQDKTPIFPTTSKNEEHFKLDDEKPFHQRFLFNSQMRLLEKKLLPEKSTKATKHKMSLEDELEALKKVEEDFQRNRANEKENVQHQLRLYFGNGNDNERYEHYHSLPISPVLDRFSAINLNDTNSKLFCRDDPEGCVSNVPYVAHESESHKITVAPNNLLK